MKYFKILLLLFAAATVGLQIIKSVTTVSPSELPEGVSVIVCHASIRCPTCTSMERLTKACLEQSFPHSGIQFRTINYQLPENAAIAQQYKIATATVLLSDKQGADERVENLAAQAWSLSGDDNAFMTMLKSNIEKFLRKESISCDNPDAGTPVEQNLNWE